jgi:hypothetical protein
MSDLQSLFKKVLEEHQLDRYLFTCRCDEQFRGYGDTYEAHLAAKLAEAVRGQINQVTATEDFHDPNWSV